MKPQQMPVKALDVSDLSPPMWSWYCDNHAHMIAVTSSGQKWLPIFNDFLCTISCISDQCCCVSYFLVLCNQASKL